MSENKFLSFVLTDGIFSMLLGLLMLVLPKVSSLSFGLMIALVFIIHGGYKIIESIIQRNVINNLILLIAQGLILLVIGLVLLFIPYFDIMLVIAGIGVYFVLKSISSFTFSIQTGKILHFWWLGFLLSLLELFLGIITIITIPTGAFWFIGVIAGLDFLLYGYSLINMYISTKGGQ